MKQEIRVLLIDDHTLFRESVRRLLQAEAGFSAVRACGHVREALSMLESEVFDVVLPSIITSKPAIRYQFKTGQRDWPKT